MTVLKCKMCGGDVVAEATGSLGRCEHCGSVMTLPRVSDERRANLYNRANHLRRMGEFDKALAAYEAILGEDNSEAEAHWGVVLSRYGIEYVEDPRSGERIPTCHRVQTESVLRDGDYLMAVEHAPDGSARSYYEAEGRRIAEIQKGILAVSAQEAPYDVFICYKETTEGGSRTRDSVLAQEIFHHLSQEKRRVFFAKISLEGVLGQKYEPYIYGALTSARVMVVVGTKAEHFNAVWVKNEWSRYLALKKKDGRRVIIPCYRDMNAYDLPEELSEVQSLDMEKIGFIQDLIRGVTKVLEGEAKPKIESVGNAIVGGAEVVALIKRAKLFLEDGEFKLADDYAERALDKDPESGEGYLCKLMAQLKVKTEEELGNGAESLSGNSLYQKSLRFGAEELRRRLEGCNRRRIDEARKLAEETERQRQMNREAEERRRAEQAEKMRLEAEARAQADEKEMERHQSVLPEVRVRVANGQLEEASKLFKHLGSRRFAGLDYVSVEVFLKEAVALRVKVETGLRGALDGLKAAEMRVPRLMVLPPFLHQMLCWGARSTASQAMDEGVQYLEQGRMGGRDEIRILFEEVRDTDRRVGELVKRTIRLVRLLSTVWLVLILVCASGLWVRHEAKRREVARVEVEGRAAEEKAMAEAKVKAEAEERERQRLAAEARAAEEKAMAEAKVKAEAEEHERQRLAAEAKAKVEATETALASKLGLIKPFVAGVRGQAGDLAVRWISSGRFTMGSPSSEPDRYSDEVQHEAVLTRGFFLAETECTQGQWEAVMGGNPSNFKGSERPVEQVSWGEAVEYCRKLTAKQRAEGILAEGWEWRLPTEAEWEYAARAGTAGARYGELDAIAWWSGNSGSETHAVSQKAANAWGLHDMIGNVWEWCADWSENYPTGSVTDPTGPSSGSFRVTRGGGWSSVARSARSASRSRFDPGYRNLSLGFRPALSSVW